MSGALGTTTIGKYALGDVVLIPLSSSSPTGDAEFSGVLGRSSLGLFSLGRPVFVDVEETGEMLIIATSSRVFKRYVARIEVRSS